MLASLVGLLLLLVLLHILQLFLDLRAQLVLDAGVFRLRQAELVLSRLGKVQVIKEALVGDLLHGVGKMDCVGGLVGQGAKHS